VKVSELYWRSSIGGLFHGCRGKEGSIESFNMSKAIRTFESIMMEVERVMDVILNSQKIS
jgi:hypothetical protein